jgi:hypothetical protein
MRRVFPSVAVYLLAFGERVEGKLPKPDEMVPGLKGVGRAVSLYTDRRLEVIGRDLEVKGPEPPRVGERVFQPEVGVIVRVDGREERIETAAGRDLLQHLVHVKVRQVLQHHTAQHLQQKYRCMVTTEKPK